MIGNEPGERAKLESITLHELRHSYASAMVRNGAPLIVVAEALGHSGTRMAEKHYAHLAPSFVAETIRRTAPDLSLPDEGIARLEAQVCAFSYKPPTKV